MKIYTKTGDKGSTALIGGRRLPKFHERIEAYGAVDELISHTGLLRDFTEDKTVKKILLFIQDRLMVCASNLATDKDKPASFNLKISEKDIAGIEKEIDRMEKKNKPLDSFILPGGHHVVSQCHVTRTVCRRAERRVLFLDSKEKIYPELLVFLNRLSDYFFVLARYMSVLLKVKELPWKH